MITATIRQECGTLSPPPATSKISQTPLLNRLAELLRSEEAPRFRVLDPLIVPGSSSCRRCPSFHHRHDLSSHLSCRRRPSFHRHLSCRGCPSLHRSRNLSGHLYSRRCPTFHRHLSCRGCPSLHLGNFFHNRRRFLYRYTFLCPAKRLVFFSWHNLSPTFSNILHLFS